MKAKRTISICVAIVFALVILFPFYLVLINSAKESANIIIDPIGIPEKWMNLFSNIKKVINNEQYNYWAAFRSSIFITVASLFLLILFASMAAWRMCRSNKKWASVLLMIFVASMIVPFQSVMFPVLSVYRDISNFTGIRLLQSYTGIIFAYVGFGGPMAIFMLHGFVKKIPYELEEAAYIDGASSERIFFQIVLPLLRPIQVTIVILDGVWFWNDYLLPSLLLGQSGKIRTLPVAIASFIGSYVKQWDMILTAALMSMLPMIILFLVAQKQIVKGMVDGAVK